MIGEKVGPKASNLAALSAFTEAWGAGDIEALMATLSDDFVYVGSVGPEPGRTYRGAADVRAGMLPAIGKKDGIESRVDDTFIHDDLAVVQWTIVDRRGAAPIETRGCDIFRFRDGKITLKDAFRKVLGPDRIAPPSRA